MKHIQDIIQSEYKKIKKETYIKNIVLEEHAKLKEDDAGLRSALDDLDYDEKGNEIDNGGSMEPHASKLFIKFFKFLKEEEPDIKIKVTGGNDNFHKGYRSRHVYGEALDFAVVSGSKDKVKDVLKKFRKQNKSDFKFLDEYENPTEHSTGGHFHMAYIGSSSVYAKKKAAGELPEVIPGTNKIVNTDGSDVALNTWEGEDENGTDLAELDNILKQFASKQKGKSSADMIKFTAGDQISHKWEIKAPIKIAQKEDLKDGEKFEKEGSLILAGAPESITFYPTGQVYLYNQQSFAGDVEIDNKDNWIKRAVRSLSSPIAMGPSMGMGPLIAYYFGGESALKATMPTGDKVLTITNTHGDLLGVLYTDQENGIVFDIGESPQYALDDEGDVKYGHGKGLNQLQFVLDIIGFIPVIGDIVDCINAIIYFIRERYIEAVLSLIAIIPVVGSVIKFGAKGAMKAGAASIKAGGKAITNLGLKGIRKIFGKGPAGVKEADNLVGILLDKKIIDPEDLMWVEKTGALDIILKKLTKSKKVFQKYLTKGTHKNIDEALDAFETMIKNLDTSIVKKIKVKGFGPKGYAKAASKAPPVSLLGRLANPITRLIGKPRIFQRTKNIITKLPPKKVELINGWIQKQIRQDIATDPSKLRTLLKTMDPSSLKKLNFPAGYKPVPAAIKKLSPGQIDAVLKVAAEEGNVFYQAMIKNPKIYFRAQLKQGTKQRELLKVMRSGIGAKQLDIIYNEISEVFDNELGIDLGGYGDEQQSIIAATFFKIFVDKESQKRRRAGWRSFINSAAEFAGIYNWISSDISLSLTEREQILNTAWNEMPGDTDGEKLQYVKTQTTDTKVIKPIVDFVKDKQQDDK